MHLIFLLVTTDEKSRDGDEIESISSIKYYAPRIYSSQYRAVTSSDYESVLGYIYPNVESVTAYGGEEMSPPRFGKFLSQLNLEMVIFYQMRQKES